MVLAIDIGNTNIVLGLFENNELKAKFRIQTSKLETIDGYGIRCYNLINYAGY